MTNKLALEAIDRTFRDLMSSNVSSARDIPFGGKLLCLVVILDKCSYAVQKEDEIIVDIPSNLLIPPTDNLIQDIVSTLIQDIVSTIYSHIDDNHGIPNHVLKLKNCAPIILLRNIDKANGLCNETRLIVQDLGDNIIGAEIVYGSNIGVKAFIPRMNLVPSDSGLTLLTMDFD
ncbi:uncharacterized protein LOC107460280 [Arachis duranensis]|uniref:Uncharacterized protein LOC107460280 n=1 Tax=Arachis duranensis TaxID=130453 RepID=A0A6P4B998_ARADU|nr:uncharacterized protein LOC107460280 [Arachis duranensis]